MRQYTYIMQPTQVVSRVIELDLQDSLRRSVGVFTWTAQVEFVEAKPSEAMSGGHLRAPGTYFAALVQITRNGARYGASQMVEYFLIESVRDAYVQRMV